MVVVTCLLLLFAAATITTIPPVVLFFFAQRTFIEGITLTGIKGFTEALALQDLSPLQRRYVDLASSSCAALMTATITLGECQKRQREHFHKCPTCVHYNARAITPPSLASVPQREPVKPAGA